MSKKFWHFQPEYVRRFICDGSACNAHCCRKSWTITIDEKTYKKCLDLQSDETIQNFLRYTNFNSELNSYVVDKNEHHCCPMLGEDNLCKLQKNCGLDFLSETCQTYPRNIYKLNGMYEWSLTVSCPVVARLALAPEESMIFENIELIPPLNTNISARSHKIPPKLVEKIFEIQFAAISILQERKFTIDQRLAILGFFLDQLDEFSESEQIQKISDLVKVYTSENFFAEHAPNILESIKFNVTEFIKTIFGDIFGNLYNAYPIHRKFLDDVRKLLKINVASDENISVRAVAENYLQLNEIRQNFIATFSSVFENYLVNEFFTDLYPFYVTGSVRLNFSVFVVAYKIAELFTFGSIFAQNHSTSTNKSDVIAILSEFAEIIDHSDNYMENIARTIQNKDTFAIMRTFLQV